MAEQQFKLEVPAQIREVAEKTIISGRTRLQRIHRSSFDDAEPDDGQRCRLPRKT